MRTAQRLGIALVVGVLTVGGHRAAGSARAAPAPLTDRQAANLAAFARLYGVIRWFHASDGAFDSDWNTLAVEGVRAVEPAADADDLIKRLEEFLQPVAPTLRVYRTGEPTPRLDPIIAPADAGLMAVAYWSHRGLAPSEGLSQFQSNRVGVSVQDGPRLETIPSPTKAEVYDLGGGVSARLPLAVYVDQKLHSVPKGAAVKAGPATPLSDRAARLGAVIAAWNAVRHFWPFFGINAGLRWERTLDPALREAAEADAGRATVALRRMLAHLGDGQAWAWSGSDAGERSAPVAFAWVEDRLVITAVFAKAGAAGLAGADAAAQADALASIKPGDVVTALDGVTAAEALARRWEEIPSGSEQQARAAAAWSLAAGAAMSPLRMTVKTDSGEREISLLRTMDVGEVREPAPAATRGVAEGVLYVDPKRMDESALAETLAAAGSMRAIIFDLRGPTGIGGLFGHFIDRPIEPLDELRPEFTLPDCAGMRTRSLEPIIPAQSPRLSAKPLFLVDAWTRGEAEIDATTAQARGVGVVVGSPTAGSLGQVTRLLLPGGAWLSFTQTMVVGPDGAPVFGVAVDPDVRVARTIEGVRAGRDELLDAAIREALKP